MQSAAIGNRPLPATSSDGTLPVMCVGSGVLCDNDAHPSIKTGPLAVEHLLGECRDVDWVDADRECLEIERVPPAAGSRSGRARPDWTPTALVSGGA